jgi:hypothetical protein
VKTGVAGKRARLFFHKESCRVVLEARHTVTIGRNGATIFTQSASRVVEDEELIMIGNCAYTYEYTPFFASSSFERDISRYMKEYCEPEWSLNKLLSPSSVGKPISLGNYYYSPMAFAQGTFGKVSAGWDKDGAAVAIKHFKAPKESEISSHLTIMRHIGKHVRLTGIG